MDHGRWAWARLGRKDGDSSATSLGLNWIADQGRVNSYYSAVHRLSGKSGSRWSPQRQPLYHIFVFVEWSYGQITQYLRLLDGKMIIKIGENLTGCMYKVAVLLSNNITYTCGRVMIKLTACPTPRADRAEAASLLSS